MKLIEISVRRPVLVAMFMIGLGGLGVFSYRQMPKEMFPEIEFPMITVMTIYEGAGPEEVQQQVTKELEEQINTTEGIKHLYGQSQQGRSLIMAEFELDVDIDDAAADVRDKVNLVRPLLPEEAEDPIVQKFDFNAQPVLQLAVSAPLPLREVYHIADERIKDRLATVPGVASITIIGGEEREIHVLTNQQRLRAYGLSITDVAGAVAAANIESPGGFIQQNSREYNLRLRGKFTSLEDIENLRLPLPSGRDIYLRDVAEVRDAYKDIRDKARASGVTCVGMSVQKRSDGNTVAIDTLIHKELDNLRGLLGSDFTLEVLDEQASWITGAIDNVFNNMYVGIALCAITLFIFLHSARSTLIVSLTIPVAVAGVFLAFRLLGVSINLMSMMGLAMTVGILVDNSVLILENVVRHLHLGQKPREGVISGASEIAIAVAATTLTNIVIFVPIAFMGGIIGQFFKDLGLAATFATVCSLAVSFTLTPMLAARLLTKENTTPGEKGLVNHFGRRFDRGFGRLRDGYAAVLRWCIGRWWHRLVSLLIVVIMLAGSICLVKYKLIGFEFITSMDDGKFIITVEMPTGSRLEETDRAVAQIEKLLLNKDVVPELVSTYATIGQIVGEEIGGGSQGVNIAGIKVELVAKEERDLSTEQVMNRLRPQLAQANIPGATIKLLEQGAGGGGAPIQLEVMGDDFERVKAFSRQALVIVRDQIEGTVDVDTNYRAGQPEIHVNPDRERCRDVGVDVRYLAQVVASAFDGMIVGQYREGAFDYDIRVRNDKASRQTVSDVNNLTVMNMQGQLIPLPQIAEIAVTTGPSQLFRKNRQSQITISADVTGRSPGEVFADIEAAIQPLLKEFPGIHTFFGGEIERMQDSFGRLGIAGIMAICLTYALLACLLESFIEPVIIMLCLPLSLIGVLVALFLMGGTFSIFSIMAIVILIGLVINNAIVVLNYVNLLRKEGVERNEAIIQAGSIRLRPMLMTNLTTIAALIPLAAGRGWGGELMAPMGMVQIGGLITGGWIGLLIVPVFYVFWDDLYNFFKKLFKRT
ncbi:MAG: efflux RND transporter permease subunit [Sedimentisphaerales bacterium]|nr:efflux RND transporter permease subunit [Sedimentisphaerales bacterium]